MQVKNGSTFARFNFPGSVTGRNAAHDSRLGDGDVRLRTLGSHLGSRIGPPSFTVFTAICSDGAGLNFEKDFSFGERNSLTADVQRLVAKPREVSFAHMSGIS